MLPRPASGFLQDGPSVLRQALRTFIDERGYQYAEDYFVYYVQTTGNLAAGGAQVVPVNIQTDSAFEWQFAVGNCDSGGTTPFSNVPAINITITDSVAARNLMNGPISFGNLFGTGEKPFVLPIPRRFMSTTQIQVIFSNYSAGTTYSRVGIALVGRKIYKDALPGRNAPPLARFVTWRDAVTKQLYSEDLYMYDFASAANLAAAASIPVTNIIEADSDFEWIQTTYCQGESAGVVTTAPASGMFAQVFDGGSARNLFAPATAAGTLQAGVPIALIAGTATFPSVLGQPRIFPAKTPITVTFTNNSGAGIANIRFTMLGRKIFRLDA